MDTLLIEQTEDSPRVVLDPVDKLFEISGKSLPEDVLEFYQPVLDWLNAYRKEPVAETKFNVRLIYFNTASSKMLLDVMEAFAIAAENGSKVEIEWHFLNVDEDMQEAGEGYAEIVDIPFKFMPYSK